MEAGIRRDDFERLHLSEVEALQRAVMARLKREQEAEARLFAMICNRTGDGKTVWKPEDFLPKEVTESDTPEGQAAIEAYWKAVGKKEEVDG